MKQLTDIGTRNRHKHDFLYGDAVTSSHKVVEGSVLFGILKNLCENRVSLVKKNQVSRQHPTLLGSNMLKFLV